MGTELLTRPPGPRTHVGAVSGIARAREEPPPRAREGIARVAAGERRDRLAVVLAASVRDRADAARATGPVLARGVDKTRRGRKSAKGKPKVTQKFMKGGYATSAGLVKRPSVNPGKKSNTGWGLWSPAVSVRGPRSYNDERGPQVLRHASTVLYYALQARNLADVEVQMMYLNERVFVATNDPSNLAALFELLGTNNLGYLVASIQANLKDFNDPVHKRHMRKLTQLLGEEEERGGGAIGAVLRAAITRNMQMVDAMDAAAARKAATHDDFKHSLIFVTSGAAHAHAEQHLLHLLVSAGAAVGPAQIWGKKRPCNVCGLSFAFFKECLGRDVGYNPRSGGFWAEDTVPGFVELVQRTGYDQERAMEWLKTQHAQSYVSSEHDDSEDVDLGKAVQSGRFRPRASGYGTESDSDRED